MSMTFLFPALLLLAWAAWRDVATRTIPNGICLALAVLGLGLRAAEGWPALLGSLGAATALFLALFACHARGLMGGGDVKLLTALALGLPPLGSWNLVVATALAGGVLACVYLALRRLPMKRIAVPAHSTTRSTTLGRVLAIELRRIRGRGPMPYGVAIAIGGALVLLQPQGG